MSSTEDRKTKKRMRGIPVYYDELKKQHGVFLTDTAWKWLQLSAKDSGSSVGEFLERWIRSEIDKA
ncbi:MULTISPECIES: hypothetical protein [Moorena]|uniref:Uncharacterized protein n=1 Tax=Moorena producens 3L TaxID=489825 RepID=F4XNR1_9CYAN|nr:MULTISPECIES: hypothetical protein [Moorena]NEQ16883.1 hypothetical protein [Moorena sp. SIO3E2]EGJ33682.1 hypothetical protein LYNGBM3L_25710 [Moorena producens 3L]NEP67999.1 hypothetical protein [Moorena sp. SIO3A5]NEQ10997.1 hypothetical protein [Moorena sp. SIO4E2]NER88132.1 hypothetical protein [Moorena sp. SIO3A2]